MEVIVELVFLMVFVLMEFVRVTLGLMALLVSLLLTELGALVPLGALVMLGIVVTLVVVLIHFAPVLAVRTLMVLLTMVSGVLQIVIVFILVTLASFLTMAGMMTSMIRVTATVFKVFAGCGSHQILELFLFGGIDSVHPFETTCGAQKPE